MPDNDRKQISIMYFLISGLYLLNLSFYFLNANIGLRYNIIIIIFMDEVYDQSLSFTNNSISKAKYQCITLERRRKLIQMVMFEGKSIYRSSKDLDFKSSTAKAIIHRYKSAGTIFIKKSEKKSMNKYEQAYTVDVNNVEGGSNHQNLAQNLSVNDLQVVGNSENISLDYLQFVYEPIILIPCIFYAYKV